MEFEMAHLDMMNFDQTPEPRQVPDSYPQSVVFNELQKEMEELQNKLKLNNRRLILFETENNRLLEEKNKLFFIMQNTMEKNQIIIEKISGLEDENTKLQATNALLAEKTNSLEQVNKTQMSELKRFTKFHLKIQNVIKPYIEQLKNSVENLKQENRQTKAQLKYSTDSSLQKESKALEEISLLAGKIKSMESDRTHTIASYEEQIHSFSKEILRLGQQNDDFAKEIGRLKKSVEFKNYYENELIKFKRIHEDDQRDVIVLNEKLNAMCVNLAEKEQTISFTNEKLNSCNSNQQALDHLLETTRLQLSKQISHSDVLTERLNRLEKLNLNLSQQMHSTT